MFYESVGQLIGGGYSSFRLHFGWFLVKKEKIFKKLSIFPLSFQTIPLPLHSK